MTDPREEFSTFWPQTVAPFGTTPQPPGSVSKLPWEFPRINRALLALWDSSKIPVPPAWPPWFPAATPAAAPAPPPEYLGSANHWGATPEPSDALGQPLRESRGLLYSFSQPHQSLPGAEPPAASRGILGSLSLPNNPWLGQPPYAAPGATRRADIPVTSLSPADLVPANRATNDATLAALRMLLPHIANPDFWKSPGPPSLTPTAEGKLRPADYDPRHAGVIGDLTNLAVDFFPVAGPAKPMELGAKAFPGALRHIPSTTWSAGQFSRPAHPTESGLTAEVYGPPSKPPRPFSADYPAEAPTDASGQLLADMEGRPLTAKYIAGRRTAGGQDHGLIPPEIWDLVRKAIGRRPIEYSNKDLDEMSGIYLRSRDRDGNPVKPLVGINEELIDRQKQYALAHETGHMMHDLAAEVGLAPFRKLHAELERVYSTLNSGKEGLRPPKRPQDYGYPDDEAPYERIAEGFRAYLTNPNYFKDVAPHSAAAFRALVNSHPGSPNGSSSTAWAGLPYLEGQRARQTMSLIGRGLRQPWEGPPNRAAGYRSRQSTGGSDGSAFNDCSNP
jgi:hypothetical protein